MLACQNESENESLLTTKKGRLKYIIIFFFHIKHDFEIQAEVTCCPVMPVIRECLQRKLGDLTKETAITKK